MKILYYFSSNNPLKTDLCLECLGVPDLPDEDKNYVLDSVAKYIFDTSKTHQKGERVFDFNEDYKYYFPDFLELGINLNNQDLDWWEFDAILGKIMLNKNSNISKIIEFRTYQKPPKNIKTIEELEHRYRLKMKREYALNQSETSINDNLEKLWNYTEKKAGESKEC